MNDRTAPRKLKFLTVIWGKRYVEEFAQVALPSFLSPGNLPALAQDGNLEILIMTTHESRQYFENLVLFATLKAVAPVRFIDIDDLVVSGNYGITLTYAYARGIMDSGDDQTSTTFVFMNSDFVLSDGSLAYLRGLILEGRPCIMSASLRARSEAVYPELRKSVDLTTGTLSMPSREMVGHALKALHPTVIGKTITQNFVSCTTYNQLYWQVDGQTLLGRYHLIFMLAISPEQPLTTINSYCDYGFVPEMVPSGRFHVIGDSDDFFMLELQPTAQEREFLLCGRTPEAEIASALSLWTTKEHRAFATVDTVFHAGELPAHLATVRRDAAATIARLQALMRQPPVTHVDHYYWISGLEAWRTLRAMLQANVEPEVAPIEYSDSTPLNDAGTGVRTSQRLSLQHYLTAVFQRLVLLAKRMTGQRPMVARWHHLHLDYALAMSWAKRVRAVPRARNLVIGDAKDPLITTLTRLSGGELIDPQSDSLDAPGGFDNIILHVLRKDVRSVGPLIERALSQLSPGGKVALFVEHADADTDGSNFSAELAQYVTDVLPPDWLGLGIEARLVGGMTKRWLRQAERFVLPFVIPASPRHIPLSVLATIAWPFIALATFANNNLQTWIGWRHPRKRPDFASAALITLAPVRANLGATPGPHVGYGASTADRQLAPGMLRTAN